MDRTLLIINNWNEESALTKILPLLTRARSNADLGLDIVFVDNHSIDHSRELINASEFPILLQPSKGLRSAFEVAIRFASEKKYDYVIFGQSDGNCDFAKLEGLIHYTISGKFDMVIASRYMNGAKSIDDTMITKLGNKFFTSLISRVTQFSYTDALVGYRMLRLSVIHELKLMDNELVYWKPEKILRTSLAWDPLLSLLLPIRGYSVSEYPIAELPRIGGVEKKKNFLWGFGFLLWTLQVFYEDRVKKRAGQSKLSLTIFK